MSVHNWGSLAVALAYLGLVTLAWRRLGESTLALPLVLLSLDLAAWNAADVAEALTGDPLWNRLDHAASSMTPAFIFRFVLSFVGRLRALHRLMRATDVYFVLLAAGALLATPTRFGGEAFGGGPLWAKLWIAGFAPLMLIAGFFLFRHLGTSARPDERVRTRLIIAALLIGALLGPTEIAGTLGVEVPRVGNVGGLISAFILAIVALRFQLFEKTLSKLVLIEATVILLVAAWGSYFVFHLMAGSGAAYILGALTMTVALSAALRGPLTTIAQQRARARELATLGRFSAQMAHDLKNPLAALKGAAQYLSGEDLPPELQRYVSLIEQQANRMTNTIERYRRLSQTEAAATSVDINALIKDVVSGLQERDHERIAMSLSPEVGHQLADRELLSAVVENLLMNALFAIGLNDTQEGHVVISTTRVQISGESFTRIAVMDNGPGMSARIKERAFDDFFTTRAQGSGMGLAMVKRTAEAHGGEVKIETPPAGGCHVLFAWPENPANDKLQ